MRSRVRIGSDWKFMYRPTFGLLAPSSSDSDVRYRGADSTPPRSRREARFTIFPGGWDATFAAALGRWPDANGNR